jgi:hypothetical protein
MTQRLQLYLEDDFAEILKQRKPRSLSLSAYCGLCIEQHIASLDSVANVPAYRVGAEDILHVDDSVYSKQKLLQEEAPITASKKILSPAGTDQEVGVGRESEGNPRKEGQKSSGRREVADDLKQHEDLIRDFWQVKQGSKADRAWSLLMTELRKIKDKYGDATVSEQLTLGINGKWKSVTLQNLNRFLPSNGGKVACEPHKHPAYRDFTAERIERERGTSNNNVLNSLF